MQAHTALHKSHEEPLDSPGFKADGKWHNCTVDIGDVAKSDQNKKIYGKIEEWRNWPIKGEYPYVYLDGLYLKRSWRGEGAIIPTAGTPGRRLYVLVQGPRPRFDLKATAAVPATGGHHGQSPGKSAVTLD